MGYTKVSADDVDSVIPEEWGGMWFLRNDVQARTLGITILELEPGGKGKHHDHADTDHEEVYVVVDGELDFELGDETVTLGQHEAIRVDPDQPRQLFNRGDELARAVIAGAP